MWAKPLLLSRMQIEPLIRRKFPGFGPNKVQEITRLLAEIAKREHVVGWMVLDAIPAGCTTFAAVKDHLAVRRFPEAMARGEKIAESFSVMDIHEGYAMPLMRKDKIPAPSRILIEDGLEKSSLVQRAQAKYPLAKVIPIGSYNEYFNRQKFNIITYNRRTEDLFIVSEKFDHVKPCPCSPGVVPCGYHNANLGFGCPFECSYCFLQNYTNAPGIVIPENMDDFFEAFKHYHQRVRIGSGETTDSLVYDDLTGFAPRIVEFFRTSPESIFEFKTKSDNISGLLDVKAASNVVVAWSVNPQDVIDREEHFTASLEERLRSAYACAAHGYRVAFHFDPVIYFPGWEVSYTDVIHKIFKAVPAEAMAWISLGTLRMTQGQKKIIENRFPANTILDAELLAAEDGKLRYAHQVRIDIYRKMLGWLKSRMSSATRIYLCMETSLIWNEIGEIICP